MLCDCSNGNINKCVKKWAHINRNRPLVSLQFQFRYVDCVWNVMAHTQKPEFVFRRNGRVHLNRQGRQSIRILAAEVCVSAVVMLDTPCSEVVWRVQATHSIRQFPLHFSSCASPCAITFQLDSTTQCDPTQLLGLRIESELVVGFMGLARRTGVYNRLVFVIVGRHVFREVGVNFDMLFRRTQGFRWLMLYILMQISFNHRVLYSLNLLYLEIYCVITSIMTKLFENSR
jgi:hypothetical protein